VHALNPGNKEQLAEWWKKINRLHEPVTGKKRPNLVPSLFYSILIRSMINSAAKALFFSFLVLLATGCTSGDKQYEQGADLTDLYLDYKITASEGTDNLTILLQYRNGGEDGDAISVPEPGKVVLDDEPLPADSSKMIGTFYELHKPMIEFTGKHTILLTGSNEKQHRAEFDFRPVKLLTVLADSISRNELVFEFEGLEQSDQIRVLLTDTSFINNGINRVDSARNGRLVISMDELDELANGPVQLEFIREVEKPLKMEKGEGGRLLVTYSLKREFFLKD